jgi:hypothetical protein
MDLKEVGWGDMEWIDLAQDTERRTPLVYMVMNFRVLQNVGKFLSSYTDRGLSARACFHGTILILVWCILLREGVFIYFFHRTS